MYEPSYLNFAEFICWKNNGECRGKLSKLAKKLQINVLYCHFSKKALKYQAFCINCYIFVDIKYTLCSITMDKGMLKGAQSVSRVDLNRVQAA